MNIPTLNLTRFLRCAVIAALLPLAFTIGCTAQENEYDAARTYDSPEPNTAQTVGPASAQNAAVQTVGTGYVRYTAPENAFTVEIPQGWQAQTRIDRSSGGGVPWSIYASPDGEIALFAPDRPGANYMLPDPRVGRHEGGYSGIFPVRGYVQGIDYATEHAQRIAHALGCRNAQLVDRRARPDMSQRTRAFLPPNAASMFGELTTGEAHLQCQYNGGNILLIAGASSFQFRSVPGWLVSTSVAIAPLARAEEAKRVIDHMNRTATPNRTWGAQQFAASQRAAQEAQMAAWRAKSRSGGRTSSGLGTTTGGTSDEAHKAFIHSIHGTTDLTDRFGDTVYGVESYSNYHWQDRQGNIVGTDIDSNPNPLEYERMGTPPRR